MLTNRLIVELTAESEFENISLSIRDRSDTLVDRKMFERKTESFTFEISFPNVLYINIHDNRANMPMVELSRLNLIGLDLPNRLLDQVCHFKPQGSDNEIITRKFHSAGLAWIDFFAADSIQYHLLYGNKIQLDDQ